MPYKLAADELVIVKLFNGSADAGTVANDATAVEKNTYVPNGTPDGEKSTRFLYFSIRSNIWLRQII